MYKQLKLQSALKLRTYPLHQELQLYLELQLKLKLQLQSRNIKLQLIPQSPIHQIQYYLQHQL